MAVVKWGEYLTRITKCIKLKKGKKKMKLRAYRVSGCKVSRTELWNGVVIKEEKETIIDAIKRRLCKETLLCEITNEGFDYDEVYFNEITLNDISMADFILILKSHSFNGVEKVPIIREISI